MGTPKWCPELLFGRVIFLCFFLVSQGSILVSFWLHFEAPRLHFEVILAHMLAPKGPNLDPCASDICSFRFCLFHTNLLRLTFYTSLRPPRPTLLKTFHHYASHKNFHTTGGGGIAKRFAIYITH